MDCLRKGDGQIQSEQAKGDIEGILKEQHKVEKGQNTRATGGGGTNKRGIVSLKPYEESDRDDGSSPSRQAKGLGLSEHKQRGPRIKLPGRKTQKW